LIGAAYFASSFFGLTEVRQAFAALLTRQGDAAQTFSEVSGLLRGEELPAGMFAGRLQFSVPAAQMLSGSVTSAYGYREDPFTGARDFHTGVDIAAPQGTAVCAAYTGTVKTVGESAVYGNYVILRHENFETRYCHCQRILAKEGTRVAAGDPIALVGATGRATGPHLHFEMLYNGLIADPAQAGIGCV